MPDGLYDRDILAWSEQQAALLRRLADGERLDGEIDWTNVIDEVETVGRSELHACETLIEQAMSHLVKLGREPDSAAARHWRMETKAFLARARRIFTPSMRQRLDLAGLYTDIREAEESPDGLEDFHTLPATCPFDLDELLAGKPDIDHLVALLFASDRREA